MLLSFRKVLVILLLSTLVVSCGPPGTPITPTNTLSPADELAAINMTASAIALTHTPVTPTLTYTTTPAFTETATLTSTPTLPCNLIDTIVIDPTIKDWEKLKPGKPFSKTWTLTNAGSCTWTSDYKLTLVRHSGESMSVATTWPLPEVTNPPNVSVPPGGKINISVQLTAPTKLGFHESYFKLISDTGELFGPPKTGNFWVRINVVPLETSTPHLKPDLVITNLDKLIIALPNEPIKITLIADVKNQGTANSGSSYIKWEMNSFQMPICEQGVPPLAVNEQTTINCPGEIEPGDFNVRAEIDHTKIIDEINEDNNNREITISVP